MGTLTLVRHGQASAFEDNYDRLSALGEEQARRLRLPAFDHVYAGPRARQQETARLAGLAFEPLDAFDEMGIEPLFKEHLPALFEEHQHLHGLGDAMLLADGEPERARAFARIFEAVLLLWVRGLVSTQGVEPWPAFQERIALALRRVCQRGQRVAVFTSAGPIALALQLATGLADERAIDCAFRIRNTSISTFVYDESRFSLETFNGTPHLTEWTVR